MIDWEKEGKEWNILIILYAGMVLWAVFTAMMHWSIKQATLWTFLLMGILFITHAGEVLIAKRQQRRDELRGRQDEPPQDA